MDESAECGRRGLRCRSGTRAAGGIAGGGNGTDVGEGGSARSDELVDRACVRASESSCGSKVVARDGASWMALHFCGEERALGFEEAEELLSGLETYT